MSAQHTPGPWELIETPHEKIISSWHVKVGEHQIPIHPYKRIWSEDRTQSGLVTDYQHMADARLIATAPDLLEALQKFVAWSEAERNHEGTTFWQRVEMLRELDESAAAAIAKATGGGND